ncbi:MAG: hypothetical protein Alpg2KO_10570 [Alphaproteobacteria bacterium]
MCEAPDPPKKPDYQLRFWLIVGIALLLYSPFMGTPVYIQPAGQQKINQTMNNLNALQGQISHINPHMDYKGTDASSLIAAGIVPANMVAGPDTMFNAWGGEVQFQPVNKDQDYRLTFTKVPGAACIALLTWLAGGSSQNALIGFSVAQSLPDPLADVPAYRPPLDADTATSICTNEESYIISFYYD